MTTARQPMRERAPCVRPSPPTLAAGEYRLVVAISGGVEVAVDGHTRKAAQGSGVVVTAGEPDAVVSAQGMAIAVMAPAAP